MRRFDGAGAGGVATAKILQPGHRSESRDYLESAADRLPKSQTHCRDEYGQPDDQLEKLRSFFGSINYHISFLSKL